MSKDKFADYDSTAASNTDVGGINIQGSASIANGDNALRELMSHTADYFASDTIASAGTTDLGSKAAHALTVTGTTTITALGTIKAGTIKFLTFADALTLTHNATSLILQGASNIGTAAGDTAVVQSLGSGNWRCLGYVRAAPEPLNYATQANMEAASSNVVAVPPGRQHYHPGHPKAWVRYNGSANTIASSYNVTSVTDNATGDFTVNFTTAFSNANYAVIGTAAATGSATVYVIAGSITQAAGSFRFVVRDTAGTATDVNFINLVFYGDL